MFKMLIPSSHPIATIVDWGKGALIDTCTGALKPVVIFVPVITAFILKKRKFDYTF
jgi:hypothetical protein